MTLRVRRHALVAAIYLAAWLVLDYLSFLFEVAPGISPWYLPHGLSLAMLAVFGPRYIPLLAAGPLINGSLFWLGDAWLALLPLSLAIAAGYGLAGTFLHRRRIDAPLSRLRDAGLFFATAFVSSVLVALLSVGALVAGGVVPAADFAGMATTFWAGDSLGLFGLAPLFLAAMAWLRRRLFPLPEGAGRAPAEPGPRRGRGAVLADGLFLAAMILLSAQAWPGFSSPPLYLLSLPVLWIAFRHGIRGAAPAVAAANAGPLLVLALDPAADFPLATLQLQLVADSIAGIALGAAVTESRRRAVQFARMQAESEMAARLAGTNSQLRERMKELQCLYRVLELTTAETRPVAEACAAVAAELRRSLLHEELAMARVAIGDSEYRTPGWTPPVAALRSPVLVEGEPQGYVEFGYAALPPGKPQAGAPFLAEERALLDGVARHVARMVKDRTTSDRLARSERINAIGQLTGGIAHDFNNLLTVILGNAEALADALTDRPRLRALADMTGKAAERGAALTGRLLSFARQQALHPGAVDVAALLHGMEGLLGRSLGEDIAMEIRCDPALKAALVDPAQLEAAVLNICINARDAMPGGGRLRIEAANVRLEAFTTETDDEVRAGEYVMLAIADTGTGMPAEVMARAFDPFFTTKPVGKGSGLGLSMVYGFAIQSGGHARLRSVPGKGSTVTLYLPQARPDGADTGGRQDLPAEGGRGERILLVEDDAAVRRYVADRLSALGYAVVSTATAAEALDLLGHDRRFDLLFTDIVMPGGIGGPDLARRARALVPGLPVLLTSGHPDRLAGALQDGRAAAILVKPYRGAELAARVRDALGT